MRKTIIPNRQPHRVPTARDDVGCCFLAVGSDPMETRRDGYNFVYDTASAWETITEVHRQQLEHQMAKGTATQAEKEETVFTSGTIIGSELFIRKIVAREEESFPTGHKTPTADFGVNGIALKTLRNVGILR